MDTDLSSLLGGRYIYFKSLQSDNHIFHTIYQDASSRLQAIGSSLGYNISDDKQKSKDEEEFRFKLEAYLSMLKSMSNQLQSNEKKFIASQIPLLQKAGINENIIKTVEKLGSGEITETEYQSIISLINTIRYGGDIEKLKTIIKEQKNNIEHMEANIRKMEHEQGGITNKTADLQELQKKYIENYGKYKREFANKLMRAVREEEKYHKQTLMDQYTNKLNSILKSIGNNQQFIELVQSYIKDQPEDKKIIITEHDLFNYIFNEAVNEVDKEENKGKQGRTIAKKIIEKVMNDISGGTLTSSIKSEFANVIKGTKRQKSIEEIAINNNSQMRLSDALDEAQNAIEIIEKFGDKKTQKANLEAWYNYKKTLKEATEKNDTSVRQSRLKFNKQFRATVLESKTVKEIQRQLGTVDGKEKRLILSKLNETLDLSFAKPLPRIDGSLEGMCSLTLSKSSLSEIIATKQDEIAGLIFNKLPGASINLKNDVFYSFKINNKFAETLAEKKTNQILEDIANQVDQIVEDAFGSFMQKYHSMTGGETDVESANLAYIDSMKKMVQQMRSLMNKLEMTNDEQEKAWEELSSIFLASISVKEYTLYNNDLGYHGGSLGSGGAPEGVVKNITRMYELGGITPMDTDALLFAILNCSPSAIGSGLKEHLESYLLGGAALIMFDEGFTASKDYLDKMKEEIGINSLPTNLNLYFLNGVYVPASYIIYNIYTNLNAFYGHLNNDVDSIKQRNRVVITNNASPSLISKSSGQTLSERFSATANAAMGQISIQFLFMAGMLDILNNLGKCFNIT